MVLIWAMNKKPKSRFTRKNSPNHVSRKTIGDTPNWQQTWNISDYQPLSSTRPGGYTRCKKFLFDLWNRFGNRRNWCARFVGLTGLQVSKNFVVNFAGDFLLDQHLFNRFSRCVGWPSLYFLLVRFSFLQQQNCTILALEDNMLEKEILSKSNG